MKLLNLEKEPMTAQKVEKLRKLIKVSAYFVCALSMLALIALLSLAAVPIALTLTMIGLLISAMLLSIYLITHKSFDYADLKKLIKTKNLLKDDGNCGVEHSYVQRVHKQGRLLTNFECDEINSRVGKRVSSKHNVEMLSDKEKKEKETKKRQAKRSAEVMQEMSGVSNER